MIEKKLEIPEYLKGIKVVCDSLACDCPFYVAGNHNYESHCNLMNVQNEKFLIKEIKELKEKQQETIKRMNDNRLSQWEGEKLLGQIVRMINDVKYNLEQYCPLKSD